MISEQRRAYNRAYREANRERLLAADRKRYAENPEKHKAASKASRLKNPERFKQATKAWQEANREKQRAANRKSHAKHRDRRNAARRAKYNANPSPRLKQQAHYRDLNRETIRERAREAARRPERKARAKAYYEANKEIALALANARYLEIREMLLPRLREQRHNDPERRTAWLKAARKWAKANPEKQAAYNAVRRVRELDAMGTFTAADWREILVKHDYRCRYCRSDGPLTIDHIIPLARGGRHDKSNIVPACLRCNTSKGARGDWPKGVPRIP